MSKKYQIKLKGCKKDTIVNVSLNKEEAALLKRIAHQTQVKSKSDCEPTLHITKVITITPNGVEGN